MLIVLGSILAGVLLYDHFVEKQVDPPRSTKEDASTVIYHIKSGEGEINLPPCRLMAVELGPSADRNKATLQIMVNKSVETECKPITDIEKEEVRETNTNSISNKYSSQDEEKG